MKYFLLQIKKISNIYSRSSVPDEIQAHFFVFNLTIELFLYLVGEGKHSMALLCISGRWLYANFILYVCSPPGVFNRSRNFRILDINFYVVKIPWNHFFACFYSRSASIWSSASVREFTIITFYFFLNKGFFLRRKLVFS